MRRKGFFSEKIGTYDNFLAAFVNSAKKKSAEKRRRIKNFSSDLEKNLTDLLISFRDGTFRTSEYSYFTICDRKQRLISKLPYRDHVFHWALMNVIEDYFTRSFTAYTYSGILGRGPHKYFRIIRRKLCQYPEKTTHFLLIDVKKFYPNIWHVAIKELLARKLKDQHLLKILYEIIDSIEGDTGLPIGTKFSQFLSGIVLSPLDHALKRCFNILNNPILVDYYTRRYISEKIDNARTDKDLEELSKGSQYLVEQFRSYLRRNDFCYRLADDILVLHNDSVFLHFLVEWCGLFLATELKLTLNHKWKVRRVDAHGIDTGGYIHFHTNVKVRKRTKRALCRHVAVLRKKGISEDEIRKKISSRLGFIKYSDCKQLLKKIGMETSKKRLGQKIKDKRTPWEDLTSDRKRKFEDILYDTRLPEEKRGLESDKIIELIDYKIEDSKIEKNADGSPKKCIIIRYKWQGEEWYSFTGSGVLIKQALTEFNKSDLPADTVIKVFENKFNKKFYRFT